MHFTDQEVLYTSYKKTLQFVFKLPGSDAEMEGIQTLTRMAFYFIDLVAKTSLSKFAKQKADKNRLKAVEEQLKETHTQRQEAAQQRKLDKLQKQKAEFESLTPDEQRRREEKQYKKRQEEKEPQV